MAEIKVTLIKSTIGAIPKHKKIVQALGIRKLGSYHIHQDNDAIRGMCRKVSHLVKVEQVQ